MGQKRGDLGLDRRNLDLLMKTGLGILAPRGGLAVGALFRHHLTDIFGGTYLLLVPFMARLTAVFFLDRILSSIFLAL